MLNIAFFEKRSSSLEKKKEKKYLLINTCHVLVEFNLSQFI